MQKERSALPGNRFCPLLILARAVGGSLESCACGEGCAWYDTITNGCAIAKAADALDMIAETGGRENGA